MKIPVCHDIDDISYFHGTSVQNISEINRDGLLVKRCDLDSLRELDEYLTLGGYRKPRIIRPILFFTDHPNSMNNVSDEIVLLGIKKLPKCTRLIDHGTDNDFGEFTSTHDIPKECLCIVPEDAYDI